VKKNAAIEPSANKPFLGERSGRREAS